VKTTELAILKRWFSSREDPEVRTRGLILIAVIEEKCLELGKRELFGSIGAIDIPNGPANGQSVIDQVNRDLVLYALRRFKGNKTHVARWLGFSRQNFYQVLKRLRVEWKEL